MSEFTRTERTKVKRKADRGSYDRELIYRILDEAFVCQVGFIADGMPFVVPTNYVRVGDRLLLCTNGLTDVVSRDPIADTLALSRPPHDDCQQLIDLARAAGSPDDVTVMVADYRLRPDTSARTTPMLAAE